MKVRIPNESRQFSFEVGMNFDPISMRFRRVQTSCGRISQKTDELLRQAAKFVRSASEFRAFLATKCGAMSKRRDGQDG